jgi:hypothetical protein
MLASGQRGSVILASGQGGAVSQSGFEQAGIEWKRRPPGRAAARLAWTLCHTGLACAAAYLFFGDEPRGAPGGAVNPLAMVVPTVFGLAGLVLVPQILALVRRPAVSADQRAFTVRPGIVRTLVLPWAQVTELATMDIADEPYLLVMCAAQPTPSGDRPRWWDQGHLRSAKRGAAAVTAYDLAVPMTDFVATPQDLLLDLAQYAPPHVTVARRAPR